MEASDVSPSAVPFSGPESGAPSGLRGFLREHRRLFLWIAVIEFFLFLLVFRGVLWSIPSIIRGENVITADELVPFFDIHSQLWDQALGSFSSLTNQFEFRIRYTLLTTWMRQYVILPFALFAVPLCCSLLMCVAVSYFLSRLTRRFPQRQIIRASALAALFFELILLYAKVTHFYSLIIGFTLFVLAFILLLFGLFLENKRPVRLLAAAHLLILFNPAVHYIVLFLLTVAVLLLGGLLMRFLGKPDREEVDAPQERESRGMSLTARYAVVAVFSVVLVVIPYALLVKYFFLKGLGDVEEQVPVSYYLIRSSSVPLLQQFGFDISAILNNFLYGDYTLESPRYSNYFYFLLTLAPFMPGMLYSIAPRKRERSILLLLLLLLVFSMWCSLGYAGTQGVLTFHRAVGVVVLAFAKLQSPVAWFFVTLVNAAINVLRFAHRFQFLTFAIAILLLPLGLAWAEERLQHLFSLLPRAKKWFGSVGICIVFMLPILCSWDYRYALLSGDLGGLLRPYPLQQFSELKTVLDRLPEGRTIVIPPSEAAKRVLDANGALHKFIDKFYIYYLDKPSVYYGMNSSIENKIDFYLFYRALLYGDYWWINILRQYDIRYVVINKELGPNPIGGVEYLRGIEQATQLAFPRASFAFRKRYENNGFILYEFTDGQAKETEQLYFDVPWDSFICYQQSSVGLSKQYEILYNPSVMDVSAPLKVVTENPEKAALDLTIKAHPETFTVPDNATVPFDENLLPSTFYSGNIYSVGTLLRATQYNFFRMILPGLYDTLTGTFMGMIGPTSMHFHATVSETGTYQVFLRAIATKNHLLLSDGGETLERSLTEADSTTQYFWKNAIYSDERKVVDTRAHTPEQLAERILTDIVPVAYQFDYIPMGTVTLEKGKHHFVLTKTDRNPFVAEGLLLLKGSGAALPRLPSTVQVVEPATLTFDSP